MKVGDKVYAEDWCEGIIDEIDGDTATIEFTTFLWRRQALVFIKRSPVNQS